MTEMGHCMPLDIVVFKKLHQLYSRCIMAARRGCVSVCAFINVRRKQLNDLYTIYSRMEFITSI